MNKMEIEIVKKYAMWRKWLGHDKAFGKPAHENSCQVCDGGCGGCGGCS